MAYIGRPQQTGPYIKLDDISNQFNGSKTTFNLTLGGSPYSIIQCRRADIIEKDGVEVGKTYHRHTRAPGDNVSDDCAELQAVATALWTPEVIAAYQAHIEASQPQ